MWEGVRETMTSVLRFIDRTQDSRSTLASTDGAPIFAARVTVMVASLRVESRRAGRVASLLLLTCDTDVGV